MGGTETHRSTICPSVPLSLVLQCDRGRHVIVTGQTQNDDFGLVGKSLETNSPAVRPSRKIEPPMEVDHSVEFCRFIGPSLAIEAICSFTALKVSVFLTHTTTADFFSCSHNRHGEPPLSGCHTHTKTLPYIKRLGKRPFQGLAPKKGPWMLIGIGGSSHWPAARGRAPPPAGVKPLCEGCAFSASKRPQGAKPGSRGRRAADEPRK